MIQQRQCLFHVTLKRSLLLFVFFTSLCVGAYAQTPDLSSTCEASVELNPDETMADGSIIIPIATFINGAGTAVSPVDGADEYYFISSDIGTLSSPNGMNANGETRYEVLTITCADAGMLDQSVTIEGVNTLTAANPDFDQCTVSDVDVVDNTGPVTTNSCPIVDPGNTDGDGDGNTITLTEGDDDDGCTEKLGTPFLIPVFTDECGAPVEVFVDFERTISGVVVESGSQAITYDATTPVPVELDFTFEFGVTTLQIRAVDASDNENTNCPLQTVTVVDMTDPVLTCIADGSALAATYEADGSCRYLYDADTDAMDLKPTAEDNCPPVAVTFTADNGATRADGATLLNAGTNPSILFNAGIYFQEGTTTVTVTATDQAGRTDMCTYTVLVEDRSAPTFTCPTQFEGETNDVGNPDCSRQLSADDSRTILEPLLGRTSTVALPDDDGIDGTLNDNCNARVLPGDREAPGGDGVRPDISLVATYMADINGDGTATAQTITITSVVGAGASFEDAIFDAGTTEVTLTFNDNSQNASNSNMGNETTCTFNVVISDGLAPEFPLCVSGTTFPRTVNVDKTTSMGCGYMASSGEFNQTAVDDCDDMPEVTYSYSLDGGTTTTTTNDLDGVVFPQGDTEVTVTAEDDGGNVTTGAAICTFTVQVTDGTGPVITDADIFPEDDDDDVAGTQVILETATDASSCGVTGPSDLMPNAAGYEDNCSDDSELTIEYIISTVPAGDGVGTGTISSTDFATREFVVTNGTPYVIAYMITDEDGNSDMSGTFEVIVLDNTDPVADFLATTLEIPLTATGDVTINAADLLDYATTGAAPQADICMGTNITDVVSDNCNSVVVYFAERTANTDLEDCNATTGRYERERTFDCTELLFDADGNPMAIAVDVFVSDFAQDKDGDVTEASRNTYMTTVNVLIVDNTDPATPTCPADIPSAVVDANCMYTLDIDLPTNIMDNTNDGTGVAIDPDCDLVVEYRIDELDDAGVYVELDQAATTAPTRDLEPGTYNVIYQVRDKSGNTSMCTRTVTVTDNVAPTFTSCPDDITVATNQDATDAPAPCMYAYTGLSLIPNVEDNCPGDLNLTYTITPSGGGTVTDSDGNPALTGNVNDFINGLNFTIDEYDVSWALQDASANAAAANCEYKITVEDQAAPTFDCTLLTDVNAMTSTVNGDCTVNLATTDTEDNSDVIFGKAATDPDGTPDSGDETPAIPAGLSDNCSDNANIVVMATFILGDEPAGADENTNGTTDGTPDGLPDNQESAMATGAFPDLTTFAFPSGTTTINLTFTDEESQVTTGSCEFKVIVTDGVAPTITTCPTNTNNRDAATDACSYTAMNGEFDVDVTTDVSDDCDNNSVDPAPTTIGYSVLMPDNSTTSDLTTLDGFAFPLGTSQVTAIATDAAGNASDPCQFLVSVNDVTNPTVTDPTDEDEDAAGIQVTIVTAEDDTDCSVTAPAKLMTPSFTDNCPNTPTDAVVSYIIDGNPVSATAFATFEFEVAMSPYGMQYVVEDGSGNVGMSSTFEVIVLDETAPTITTCPASAAKVLEADGTVTLTVAELGIVAEDNCGLRTPTTSEPNPYFMINGVKSATMIFDCKDIAAPTNVMVFVDDAATDVAGAADPNQSEACVVAVTITDDIDPTITCPANVELTANGDCEGVTTLPTPAGIDNTNDDDSVDNDDDEDCPLTYQFSSDGGTTFVDYTTDMQTFPLGTTTLTYQVTDASGNTGTCVFDVIVTDDSVPALVCADGNNDPTDNNYTFDIGDDADPNTCGFVNDVAATNGIAELMTTGTCTSGDVTLSYDVTYDGTTTTVSSLDGVVFELGTTNVVATATIDDDSDANTPEVAIAGNCVFTVTITDNDAASFTCPEDMTVETTDGDTGCGTRVEYTPPAVPGGACDADGSSVELIEGFASGEVFPVGTTTVTYELKDVNGLTIDMCSFDVVVTDATAPTADCADQTVTATTGCQFTIIGDNFDPTNVEDNCGGIVTRTYTITDQEGVETTGVGSLSGETLKLGVNTIEYTFTDDDNLNDAIDGNESNCSYTITVEAPVSTFDLNAGVNSLGEGDSGTSTLTYTVTRSNAQCPASVSFSITDGTATAGIDYMATPEVLNFAAGDNSESFEIQIIGDEVVEEDETFTIELSNPSGDNTLGVATAAFTIINDDEDDALAVNWLSFTAMATDDKQVALDWEVAEEFNTSHFVVERSADGQNFVEIGQALATKSINYTYTDAKPLYGLNYYRLREVANDGSTDLSEIATINLKTAVDFTLYPNPTTGVVTIDVGNATFDKVLVLDALGKVVMAKTADGINEIDLSILVPGLYFLQIEVDGEYYQQRVVKE